MAQGRDRKAARDLAQRALELVDLVADGGRSVGVWSRGMRQRLKLGLALAGESVVVSWHVECAKAVWLKVDGTEYPVVGNDFKMFRITETTRFKLKIKKTDGDFVYSSFTVFVD